MDAMIDPPLLVLGVRRSGTTLLRVILDRNSALAVPDESYFIPQIADRHRGRVDPDRFVDDLRRLPTLVEWNVDPREVRNRLRRGCTTGEAIAAVYQAYADAQAKPRWGDKTPMYMGHLELLESLFPDARYVHLIRDGRDAALSFLAMPAGITTEGWGHPRDAAGFARQWRTEVVAARSLGRRAGERYLELRYEALVDDPPGTVQRICSFAGLPWEPSMLEYAGAVDVSGKPHQQNLLRRPTAGLRRWREEMAPTDVAAFEAVAGDLLAALGYELAGDRRPTPPPVERARLLLYRAQTGAWRATGSAVRRSPAWQRRHPPLR